MDNKKMSEEEAEAIVEQVYGEGSILAAYERKIHQLRNLIEVAKFINATLEKETLLESILYSCQGQMGITCASIFINDIINDSLFVLETSIGLNPEPKMNIDEESPVIDLLKRSDASYITIRKQLKAKAFKSFLTMNKTLKGELIFPLKMKNKLNGFLILGSKLDGSEFTSKDIWYLSTFTEMASISVENMILFEVVTLDRMTKLYNHYYFQNRLVEEVNRAVRYLHNLSVVLIDLDFFKQVNDSYGHQEGDHVLKFFAALLRKNVRNTDILARYGGEEFAIILPESDLSKGKEVSEKIREAMAEVNFSSQPDREIKLTASFGVSSLVKTKAIDEIDLVHLADKALYYSKENGRNRVTLYNEME